MADLKSSDSSSTNLFGADGAVGGGGSSGLQLEAAQELMTVYQGANNLSRSALGSENQFNIDLQNKVVVFDPNLTKLKRIEVMSFEDVAKYAVEPNPEVSE